MQPVRPASSVKWPDAQAADHTSLRRWQNGNPLLTTLGIDQSISTTQSGGNMEGKEVRFGAAACGMFAGSTTGTSTGAVNCMHDSFTPLGGAAPLTHMTLGEISPGRCRASA